MCGRYSFAVEDALIQERFGLRVRTAIYKARYNCAPGQDLAVISNENAGELNFYRWGLIPYWAKEPGIGSRMINARAETILERPSFKNIFRNRRCLVVADSFFEWKKDKNQTPFRILMQDESLFSMAGIWDQWISRDGEIIRSFSIITTKANELMAGIHERMPVILQPQDEKKWLDQSSKEELLGLLKPFPAFKMKAYPVSKLVNSTMNDCKEIISLSASFST